MHPQGKDETKVKAYERLLQYVTFWTTSDEESATVPSTARQLVLAQALRDEMTELGISAVRLSDTGYVYGIIPATPGYEDRPALGFIAHMDTAPDFNGEGVRPRLIPQYDGREIVLGDSGRVLSPTVFPHLPGLAGRTLIVTDGTTLLGADDKAGIAEIMTMAECLLRQDIPHGKVCIAFTPDEEIGRGPDDFDVPGFGADFAYTVDGDVEGSIEYQNFNAAAAVFRIRGVNVHPGSAKDVMINAALVAMDINSRLPAADTTTTRRAGSASTISRTREKPALSHSDEPPNFVTFSINLPPSGNDGPTPSYAVLSNSVRCPSMKKFQKFRAISALLFCIRMLFLTGSAMRCDPFPSFGTPPALTRVFCLPDTWIPGIF